MTTMRVTTRNAFPLFTGSTQSFVGHSGVDSLRGAPACSILRRPGLAARRLENVKLSFQHVGLREISSGAKVDHLNLSSALSAVKHASSPIQLRADIPSSSTSDSVDRSSTLPESLLNDFIFYPSFLSDDEQRVLLQASLLKLEASKTPSRDVRKKRKAWKESTLDPGAGGSDRVGRFLPDELYDFEHGHFDGVIHQYREVHLSSWPADGQGSADSPSLPLLSSVVARLHALFASHLASSPTANAPFGSHKTQTHLLHLSSAGEILPHVDNVDASGRLIMGVSLGAARILCLRPVKISPEDQGPATNTVGMPSFDVLLQPGSVYVQRDAVRYLYDHSILRSGEFLGQTIYPGQRLSVMIRDLRE